MFGILTSLTKAAIGVVTIPVAVVADVVTLGGELSNQRDPYTSRKLKEILENIDKATK